MPAFDINANTKAAQANVRDLSARLDETADALDDLARETSQAGDQAERNFRDMVRDAGKAEAQLKDTAKAAERIGDDGKRGLGIAGDATSEFKDEALSNLSEVASSFDGSMESIGELAQGTLGGMTAALPGLGLVGAAAAAGIGLATEAYAKAEEASDAARESAYEYGLTVAAAGTYADAAARINELTGSVEGLKQVQDIATVAGWRQKDVVTALATGDGLPALWEAFEKGANNTMVSTQRTLELEGALQGARQGFDLATGASELQARALYDLATKAGTATGEVDDLGNTIVRMPDGKEVVIDAATRQAHEDLDALERRSLPEKVIPVRADTSRAAAALDALQAKASRGIDVIVRPGMGRTWE